MQAIDRNIAEKISKLLELSNSSNEHEAANAARAAQKLMLKYDLDMKDIEASTKKEPQEVIKDHFVYGRIRHMWMAVLISSCTKAYLCRTLRKGHDDILIVGKPHHVQICKSMYYYLERAMEANLTSAKKTNKINSQSFKEGWVIAVSKRLKDMMLESDNDEKTNALIVSESAIVEAYLKENSVPGVSINLQRSRFEYDSFYLGKENGSKVSLNTQIP